MPPVLSSGRTKMLRKKLQKAGRLLGWWVLGRGRGRSGARQVATLRLRGAPGRAGKVRPGGWKWVPGVPALMGGGQRSPGQVWGLAGPSGALRGTLTPAALSRLWEGVFAVTNQRQEGGAAAPRGSGIGGAAARPGACREWWWPERSRV